jgi:hypothetical protein
MQKAIMDALKKCVGLDSILFVNVQFGTVIDIAQ